MLTNGMAALAVGLMGYLLWLTIWEKLKQRKARKELEERRKAREGTWGYE